MTKKHIPFSKLIDHPADFIDNEYVPLEFTWKDPRNMTKAAILIFCQYICGRQIKYGPENAFMFRQYHDRKDMVQSEYGHVNENEGAAERSKKQKATRQKSKGKSKQRGLLSLGIHDANTPVAQDRSTIAMQSTDKTFIMPSAVGVIGPMLRGSNIDDNIDPMLHGSNNRIQDIDKASVVLSEEQEDGDVIVNEEQMCLLLEQGHPAVRLMVLTMDYRNIQ